ncbi:hypothetical protein bas08_0059 [Escherichia phage DanielBernoulli]|uniref:Uncharacterized protein n=1 Tax=Escherichia phage DanielBernoulli TaxID=2851972 RepID=A0AAE7VQF2_9CAUD|nr:hypothetical protein bas08_0059 [Escherichia phage DanielBernoulli]
MNDQKFVGKKVRVKALGEFIGVWTFDSEREYEILYTRMDWLHIVDNRGLSLCLCVTNDKSGVYAPGVDHLCEIEVIS